LDNIPWIVVGPGTTSSKSIGRYPIFETPILENDIHWTRQKRYFPADIFKASPPGARYQRFYGFDRKDRFSMRLGFPVKLKSFYGWTWRGIQRPFDRELGVAGGELAVIDLRSGDVLALRRGFVIGAIEIGHPVSWGGGNVCPEYRDMPGLGKTRNRSKDFDFSFWFVNKALIPIRATKE
jgi:hypothetical protein